jgi:hypothetical protein
MPQGESNHVPFNPLQDKIVVNSKRKSSKKELIWASKSIEKKNFIIVGLTNTLSSRNPIWYKILNTLKKCCTSFPFERKCRRRSLIHFPPIQKCFKRG